MTRRVRSWLLAHSLLASLLLHGALFGGALGYLHWRESQWDRAMQIDMSGKSLLLRPENLQGGRPAAPPAQPWILASGHRFAPPPQAEPVTQSAQPEEAAGPPCPPPCPERAGDWVSGAATSRLPAGFEDLVSEDDVPREVRQGNQDGYADVELYIDATGVIRKVLVLRSSHPALAALLQKRLDGAKVRPAYGANGEPVPCRYLAPFHFQLQ